MHKLTVLCAATKRTACGANPSVKSPVRTVCNKYEIFITGGLVIKVECQLSTGRYKGADIR